jgi:dihydrofolate synthase/folylpolyglutamate synthase
MNFQDTLEYMYRLLPMYQRVGNVAFKKDLTNTYRLLDILDNPHRKFRAVHIAGTNGKGSSAHMLASISQMAGYKTGLYTSPHLKRFTERIKIDGKEIDEPFVCEFIEKLQGPIEEIQPSFFEIAVAMAFDYFALHQVDIAIVEVGLGGRFDSTNVLHPVVSIITSISYDHMDMLGNTLREIAFEKAGIIKPSVPVVISETQEEIAHVFREKAGEMNADIYFADQEFKVRIAGSEKDFFGFQVEYDGDLTKLQSDLGGHYQLKNIPGVLKVVSLLNCHGYNIDNAQLKDGLKNVCINTGFKGRWQKIGDQPLTICDTAHNEAGAMLLMAQIHNIAYKTLHIVWGAVEGKDIKTILRHLPKKAFYYFCEPDIPRAMRSEKLLEHAKMMGLEGKVFRSVNDALKLARQNAGKNDLIIVAGSNFIVAEINEL